MKFGKNGSKDHTSKSVQNHIKAKNDWLENKLKATKKLLVVDDQNGIRALLVELFKATGFQTFQASNGRLAIDICKKENPDIVLLDVIMPGLNG